MVPGDRANLRDQRLTAGNIPGKFREVWLRDVVVDRGQRQLLPGTGPTLLESELERLGAGKNGILVTVHGADQHTSYTGSTDIKTGYATLVEVRRVQDFEGVVQLGLGISGPACYRAFILTNPAWLVIDLQAG